MIKIKTSRFGEIETADDKLIYFPAGLVGLSNLKKFIIIDHKDSPLKWMQSIDEPDMAFIVASPDTLVSGYTLDFDKSVRQSIQSENDADIVVLVIIRVSGEDIIANFQGPLVINAQNRRGMQVILEGSNKMP